MVDYFFKKFPSRSHQLIDQWGKQKPSNQNSTHIWPHAQASVAVITVKVLE